MHLKDACAVNQGGRNLSHGAPVALDKLGDLVMGELQRVGDWEGANADDLLNETVALKRRKFCTGLNGK